jgi:cobalt transporter subunit CbtB
MAARTVSTGISISISERIVAGIIALLLGSFLIYGVGLSHSQTLHDTAHDSRHSYGFPCH